MVERTVAKNHPIFVILMIMFITGKFMMPGRQGMKIPDLFDGNNDGAVPWRAGRLHFADHMKFRAVMMIKDFFGAMAMTGFKFIANGKPKRSPTTSLK